MCLHIGRMLILILALVLALVSVENLSTGLISTNLPIARVIFFTNPMQDAYNGLSFLNSEEGQESCRLCLSSWQERSYSVS